jgi:DNA-binding NarL/FixJ family response regulator
MSFLCDTGTSHDGAAELIPQSDGAVRLHTVFLADDHKEMLRVAEIVLSRYFHVIGTAGDGQGVLERAPGLCPDVIVLDISMPLMNGMETALRLRASACKMKFVFLTVCGDLDFLKAALSTGIVGYVLKPRMWTDLVPAIRAVLDGKGFISPSQHWL